MKKIYEHMMNCRLHTRLMLYFSTLVIMSMLAAAGISYFLSYQTTVRLAESFSTQSIESVKDNFNDMIREAENLAALVESDSLFQEILKAPRPGDIKEQYSLELQYDFELYRLLGYTSNTTGGLYVLGKNGLNFKSHNVTFQQKDFRQEEWYRTILEADKAVWFAPQIYSRVSKSIDRYYAAMGYPVTSKISGEKIGVILIEIDEESMKEILRKYGNIENGILQIENSEQVLFQKTGSKLPRENKGQSIFSYRETLENGWEIKADISRSILRGGTLEHGVFLGIVLLGLILAAVKITDVISRTVTNPIHRLIELMDDAETRGFDVQMHVSYKDEIADLGNRFNEMMKFTRHLIDTNNREQENLREAELKALQMQINPHFLYNTLETVSWLIRSGEGEKAIDVVSSLSRFFRIGLSKGRTVIPLEEELEHVKEYMNIQNIRYGNRIDFSIEVNPKELLARMVPKLILQPLVENAIYHGIQETERGCGKIQIDAAYIKSS